MLYRNFGNSGLKVSVITMGQLTNFTPEGQALGEELIKTCLENGINHFDTAEIYSAGKAESQLGAILKVLGVPREEIVISTKILSAPEADLNSRLAINRKHIKEGLSGCLARLQMDYVDVVYAHLFDDNAPLEEVCRGFHEVIEAGQAFYWATSNWSAVQVMEALAICERLNLHRPIGGQNYYNILKREEAEVDYLQLLREYKYGLIAWSPLAGGYLTGKYLEQAEETARYNLPQLAKYREFFFDPIDTPKNREGLTALRKLAEGMGFKLLHLCMAWAIKYEYLDSVVIGPKNVEQLREYLRSLEFLEKLTP
jgi:voltage-dependent potassium channel beta subunit